MNYVKQVIGIILFLTYAFTATAKRIDVAEIRCENEVNPLGVQSESPLFAWILDADERNVNQTAYRILVSDNPLLLKKNIGNIWDSGKCVSDESINVRYLGQKLKSSVCYYWKVKVWDNRNTESAWSSVGNFRMGLLGQSEWDDAKWIAMDTVANRYVIYPGYQLAGNKVEYLRKEAVMPQFRKAFRLNKREILSAVAYISGLGHFELSVNGKKVGNHFLDPGWSKYDKSSLYVTFDVTDKLRSGENVVGVRLGNGFLHIPRDSTRYRKLITTFSFPKMICKIRITYSDGSIKDINSDSSWKVAPSPIVYSSIYGGEDFDATLEQIGWNDKGFNDRAWRNALEVSPIGSLLSQTSRPLAVRKVFEKVHITETQPGVFIYDFGQNASGIVELKVSGQKGSKVWMKPAEYLTDDGLANQNNSGTPYWFSYVLSGKGHELWKPSFSYYGFRYVQVEGAVPRGYKNPKGLPVIEDLKMLHVSNSSERVGTFECSNTMFNDIYSLIDWSIKSNMSHVLTDCPHREKLGWLEVAHLMSNSIAFCYDIKNMYTKTIEDMKDSQLENGLIPNTAPEYAMFPHDFRDSPEWGSAGVILPWFIYKWYGDITVLEKNYKLMSSYVDYLTTRTKHYILYHGLGDWYDLGPNHPGYSQLTTRGLTSTAFYYYDLSILAEVSKLLGKRTMFEKYNDLAQKVKVAFNAKFFNSGKGYYDNGSQTANSLPLYMGLVDDADKTACLKQIVDDIRKRGNSITSGDIGFSFLLKVLEQEGRSDVIFDMNSQCDKPGYGYQLKQGATSLTESWAALKTASHNHCMLGHLMEWFYGGIGGIRIDKKEVAFKKFMLAPEFVGNIHFADVKFQSPYGEIRSNWVLKDGKVVYKIKVPVNTRALICLPTDNVMESGESIKMNLAISFKGIENGRYMYEIGSGEYEFIVSRIK